MTKKPQNVTAVMKRLLAEGGTGEEINRHLPTKRKFQLAVAQLGSPISSPINEHFYSPEQVKGFFGSVGPKEEGAIPRHPKREGPKAAGKNAGGRPTAAWWPAFAEELAVYFTENGLPEDDQAAVTKIYHEISERLRKKGFDNVGETTAKPVIRRALERLRRLHRS